MICKAIQTDFSKPEISNVTDLITNFFVKSIVSFYISVNRCMYNKKKTLIDIFCSSYNLSIHLFLTL